MVNADLMVRACKEKLRLRFPRVPAYETPFEILGSAKSTASQTAWVLTLDDHNLHHTSRRSRQSPDAEILVHVSKLRLPSDVRRRIQEACHKATGRDRQV